MSSAKFEPSYSSLNVFTHICPDQYGGYPTDESINNINFNENAPFLTEPFHFILNGTSAIGSEKVLVANRCTAII